MSQIIGRGNLIVMEARKESFMVMTQAIQVMPLLTPKEADGIMDRFKRKFGIVNKLYEIMVTNKKVRLD